MTAGLKCVPIIRSFSQSEVAADSAVRRNKFQVNFIKFRIYPVTFVSFAKKKNDLFSAAAAAASLPTSRRWCSGDFNSTAALERMERRGGGLNCSSVVLN